MRSLKIVKRPLPLGDEPGSVRVIDLVVIEEPVGDARDPRGGTKRERQADGAGSESRRVRPGSDGPSAFPSSLSRVSSRFLRRADRP